MKMLSKLDKKTILVGAVGLVVGLLIGWIVIGWWLWPVQWVDADPWDLRPAQKEVYVAMVSDSLANNGDYSLAQQRLRNWDKEELTQILQKLVADRRARQLGLEAQHLEDLRMTLGLEAPPVAAATPVPGATPETPAKQATGLLKWLPLCLGILVLLLIAIAAVGYLAKRRKGSAGRLPVVRRPTPAPSTDGTVPLSRFVATYRFGEETYDESFSIESPEGDFLGECGMAISETLPDGTPNRATALEVWLFDKSDIRTVTQVLMSEWAYANEDLRAALAAKGELILAGPGQEVVLETERLRVKATMREVSYGTEQPTESYFDRFVVDLDTSMKPSATPEPE
jgi:hypothetical protein